MFGGTKKGFSYIEVLIAIAISAIVFTAVMPLFFSAISKNKDTRQQLMAYEAAANKVEELRDQKVPSLVAPNHTAFTVPEIDGAVGDVYVTKPLGDARIAAIRVTIDWAFKGRDKHIELNTYLYGSTE